jgi:two-component system chemotaxis response regulator CheY
MSTTAKMMTKVVKLPQSLDSGAAAELLDKLRQLPEVYWPVHLHAQAVERLSLAYIQVVVAAMRANERFAIVDPSAVFAETFAELGLSLRQADCGSDGCDQVDVEVAPAGDTSWNAVEPAMSVPEATEPVTSPPMSPESEAEASISPSSSDQGAAPHMMEKPKVDTEAQGTAGSIAPELPAEEPVAVGRRILTIDDSKTIRDMLKLTLAQAGFTVLQAVDGQDGLEVLRKEEVDVVITDINMPKLDGYGVIRQIREDPTYDDTPILVLSTESDQENKNVARDAGATGWIVKPFVPDQLVDVIRKVCP